MRISRFIAGLALSLAVVAPIAAPIVASAQQSSAQVQTAVRNALQAADLTMRQKMQIKPMVQQYQTDTANADAAQKKTAQEALMKKIYGVLTPDQQAKFKASLKASMGSAPQHS